MKKFKVMMLNFFKKRMTADQVLELNNMIKNEVIKLILKTIYRQFQIRQMQ